MAVVVKVMVMTVVVVVDVAVVLVLVVAVLRSGLLRFHQHTSPCAAAATNLAHHGASYAILACCVGGRGFDWRFQVRQPLFSGVVLAFALVII